jgi:hypothetical protein
MATPGKLVVIESPYRGKGYHETEINILYAQACVHDSLRRGEDPYASHLFFTQIGLLDDTDKEERDRGLYAGMNWGDQAGIKAVYIDRGISHGMELGITHSAEIGQKIVERNLSCYEDFLKNVTEDDINRVRAQFIF